MSSKNDVVIKELMAKVEEQKTDLGPRIRATWRTNGVFKRDSQSFFNLNTVTDPTVLAGALGFLISQETAYDEGCRRLGIKTNLEMAYKWDNYTVPEWEDDFATRIRIIEWDKKKKILESTQAKLKTLVSEEERTSMELEDIKKLLA